MNRGMMSNPESVLNLVIAVWGALCALVLAAPFLAAHHAETAAAGIYLGFSFICHQSPERVFTIFDFPMAVCHRCCGIYLGFFLGALFRNKWLHRSPAIRRNWILAAVCVPAFDALAPFSGLWTNTTWTRFGTGLLFGIAASSLLMQGMAELLAEAPWRRFAPRGPRLQGGLS
ncbi:MAG: DUF2085 domain-containing protein [Acidobacteria bacterium]|nr:DUF2085 domain-containing protein [Acidobacteriota bacterium]